MTAGKNKVAWSLSDHLPLCTCPCRNTHTYVHTFWFFPWFVLVFPFLSDFFMKSPFLRGPILCSLTLSSISQAMGTHFVASSTARKYTVSIWDPSLAVSLCSVVESPMDAKGGTASLILVEFQVVSRMFGLIQSSSACLGVH